MVRMASGFITTDLATEARTYYMKIRKMVMVMMIKSGDDQHGEGCCHGYSGKEGERG